MSSDKIAMIGVIASSTILIFSGIVYGYQVFCHNRTIDKIYACAKARNSAATTS